MDKFEKVAGERTTGKLKERVRKHVDDAMRRSQLVADADLDTFSANVGGRKFTAVVPKGVKLKSAVVVTEPGVDEVGLGAEFEVPTDSVTPSAAGHSAGSGLPRVAGACRTLWFDNPTSGANDDQVYDCYEKFKKSNSEYIYNRYSKMTVGQTEAAIRREVQEFTIRFREAKGYSRITGGPYNYGPLPSSLECNNAKFSYGGLEIPLVGCGGIQNLAGGSYYQTGTKYLGHETSQKYIDSYARYVSNGSTPVWSDYVWVTMSSCGWIPFTPCVNGLNKWEETYTDGLWYR
ncbi:hypothetical protein KOI35_40930 [Actinoplanes bogorensis]|uniref:Uncharacterized protein n=1 Tax=Paractinoplanes bogorensis TaxID=1610840 RepID=A0ABS5Z2H5_9ACTN|nr:hypothetical protein [Actinoplanes bogorensis]MBU2669895.1 hypothetical protein [Actinoplanes bogorensis]